VNRRIRHLAAAWTATVFALALPSAGSAQVDPLARAAAEKDAAHQRHRDPRGALPGDHHGQGR